MLIACENCYTHFNLDPTRLPPGGHKVRCTKCQHIWFVKPAADTTAEAAMAVLEGTSFEAALAQSAAAMPEPDMSMPDKKSETLPTSLKQVSDTDMPVVDHNPGGMGANQFGLFTFLLLTFVSLIAALLLRAPIVHHWPAMGTLYKTFGLSVHVPGEGLKLAEMTVTQQTLMLNISAKLSNISDKPIDYPKMKVYMRGPYGASLKEWDIPAQKAVIQPSETVPVNLTLTDAPAEGKTVDLVVDGD